MKLVIGNMNTRAVGNDRFKFLEALEDLKGIVPRFLEGLPVDAPAWDGAGVHCENCFAYWIVISTV